MTLNKFCPVAQGEYYNNKSVPKSQLFFLFFSIKIFAQDPIQDTISPVVKNDTIFNAPQETIIFPKTYWNIGNEKRYNVTTSEVKLEDDTISHQEQYTYNVIIQVENVYQNQEYNPDFIRYNVYIYL